MQFIFMKLRIFALLIAIAPLTSGVLTSCTEGSTSKSTTVVVTATPVKQDVAQTGNTQMGNMNHAGMSGHMSMELGAADAEYDLRFIDAMIPHHQGAILMAKEAMLKSTRPEVKKLAEAIIQAQSKEIAQLQQWRKVWYPKASEQAVMWHAQANHTMPMTQEYKQAMMMDVSLGDTNPEFDLRFINAMVPHHDGALVMAKDAQNKSKRVEIQNLAKNILNSQQTEIDEMKQWRKTWYNK
jgi:uncharacterized protein (DUF305 family)